MESEQAIKELNQIGNIVREMGNPSEWTIDQWEDLLLLQQRAETILVQNEAKCCLCKGEIVGIPAAKVQSFNNLLCPDCTFAHQETPTLATPHLYG